MRDCVAIWAHASDRLCDSAFDLSRAGQLLEGYLDLAEGEFRDLVLRIKDLRPFVAREGGAGPNAFDQVSTSSVLKLKTRLLVSLSPVPVSEESLCGRKLLCQGAGYRWEFDRQRQVFCRAEGSAPGLVDI